MDYANTVYLLPLSCVVVFLLLSATRRTSARQLPPMPPGALPIVGHLLQMPKNYEWLKYLEWGSRLGSDIICYKILGTHVVVLNSMRAINALLEGKAAIYSDRPPLLALRYILGFHWIHGVMPYGKHFLEVRKAANHYLHSTSIAEYQPVQIISVNKLLRNIVITPDRYIEHAREMAGHIILVTTYGVPPSPVYIQTVTNAVAGLNLGLGPRGLLHDMFPILMKLPEWFPFFQFKTDAKRFAPYVDILPDLPLAETRKAMAKGTAPHSIAASMYSNGKLSHEVVRSVTGSLYVGGLETTTGIIGNFFLAMIKYPEVLKKAQLEIENAIGTTRLPRFGDEAKLPYVGAVVKELYRWRNVTPQATPHRLTTEDVYKGYRLPKDSIVIANTYAILHDPIAFPEPNVFRPERYLDPSTRSPDLIFGYGGRICPGRFLAKATTWLAIANLLATLHIERALDATGNPIEPDDVSYTDGVVCFPLPFKCKIVPRSEAALLLINSTAPEEGN